MEPLEFVDFGAWCYASDYARAINDAGGLAVCLGRRVAVYRRSVDG